MDKEEYLTWRTTLRKLTGDHDFAEEDDSWTSPTMLYEDFYAKYWTPCLK